MRGKIARRVSKASRAVRATIETKARSGRGRRRDRVDVTIAGVSFAKIGIPGGACFDPYRFAIALGWRQFALFFFAIELAMIYGHAVANVLFAGLYLLQPGSIGDLKPHGFLGAFFFSVETLSTAGYVDFPTLLEGNTPVVDLSVLSEIEPDLAATAAR